jgi:hypothetical protein
MQQDVGAIFFIFHLYSTNNSATSGELEVLHGETPVHKYVAGDSFGESSLLFEKPRS